VATHLKSEPEPRQGGFEVVCIINQIRRLGNRHLLLKFSEKEHGKLRCSGRKEPNVEELARLGIKGNVQPTALIIHLNHRLVDHDVIALLVGRRSAFCTQLWMTVRLHSIPNI